MSRRRDQWFIASNAIRVSRRSTPSWVISSFWTQCGQPHRTWPSRICAKVLGQWLGEQDDIAVRQELVTGAQASDIARQLPVRHAEPLAITALKVDAPPQVGLDPLDMQRVDRQPSLVLLP